MPMLPAKYLTIHCAATPEGRNVTAADIVRWHGGKSPYHFIVELNGTFKRMLPDSQIGAHTGGRNTGNIGICYIGGCDRNMQPKDTRTDAQKKSLLTLVRTYRGRFPDIVIKGHRDWSPDLDGDGVIEPHEYYKACPSFDVKSWLTSEGIGP